MAIPAVTYTFSNGTTADGTQVTQNFSDIVNGLTDGTKSLTIDALTCGGAASFQGNVTLGNGTPDDIAVTGSLASTINIKTTNLYNIGSSTLGLAGIYFGSSGGAFTTRILGGAVGASYSVTLPAAAPTLAKSVMTHTSGGVASFENRGTMSVVTKTANYTATLEDELILCDASGGAVTITLPAAATSGGKVLTLKRTDSTVANAITIDGNASETIDGATTTTLARQYQTTQIVCDGSNWAILDYTGARPYGHCWLDATRSWTQTGALGNPSGLAAATSYNAGQNSGLGTIAQFTTGGNWYPGITVTPNKTGKYEVIITASIEQSTVDAFGIVDLFDDTTSTQYDVKSFRCARVNTGVDMALVGIIPMTAATSKTIMCRIGASAGTTTLGSSTGSVTKPVVFSIKFLSE